MSRRLEALRAMAEQDVHEPIASSFALRRPPRRCPTGNAGAPSANTFTVNFNTAAAINIRIVGP